jgi:hypothetical protein
MYTASQSLKSETAASQYLVPRMVSCRAAGRV